MPRRSFIEPLAFAGLLLLTVWIYLPVAEFSFVNFDDNLAVTDNPWLRRGFTPEVFRWAFGSSLFFFSENAEHWMPLTLLSRVLDVQLFGLHAGGHHLVSLFWHLANTCMLFAALRALTRSYWPSLFCAALFAVHPFHVEPVAWIAARKDLITSFFFLLTLFAYARYAERSDWKRYALVLVSFILCIMAKPMGVMLPFVLVLLDCWPLNRIDTTSFRTFFSSLKGRVLLEKIPLGGLALVAAWIAIRAQSAWGAVTSSDVLPFTARLSNSASAYLSYLSKTIYPTGLTFSYPYPASEVQWLPLIFGGLLLGGVSVLAVYWRKERGWFGTGWFWFLGTLLPVIGLVQLASNSIADRFTYVPLTGLFILVAWGGRELLQRSTGWTKTVLMASTFVIILEFSGISRFQVETWRNTETLAKQAIKVTPDSDTAHLILGAYYLQTNRIDEALAEAEKALAINNAQPQSYCLRARIALLQGRDDAALADLENAIRSFPGYAEAWTELGFLQTKLNHYNQAAVAFTKAAELRPSNAANYWGLGLLFQKVGKTKEAIGLFRKAVAVDPKSAQARQLLEEAEKQGQTAPAP